ncbi:ABC transporter permease [Hespellia stercorisuis]|uniref:Oligopeptide transport system permease protein n=1 Tax=Hespellia stercorisuis DSM 15480 TaxID=1121950 RepID=A0A1M6KLY1_9FIRM|nr:ABC transporter permease [Hespellia stercorisuis]SHJ59993.1 oligopeptide transport system permease protein [Hespellia stercorisuis DSM 15480]
MQNIPIEKFQITGLNENSMEAASRPQVGYLRDAWMRLRKNKVATASLILLFVIVLMVMIGPKLSGYAFEQIDKTARNAAPCAKHWFGTDKLGRDIFARVWISGRVSLTIGVLGALICAVIGCIYGGIAAYFGGAVDTVMMRIVEILISVPYLIVVIVFSLVLQSKGILTLILAMTITGWCTMARFVRAQMLAIKNEEYILAAQALGVRPWKVILRHMIPNTLSTVIVSITFDIPGYIFSEAFLSYIGLGIQPPNTSWGVMASSAQSVFTFYPYQLFFPAVMIALTMLCFTLLGDGLRDALDPKLRK